MRFYASLYLLVVGLYLMTTSGRIGLSDNLAMFNVTNSIVSERSLSSEPCDPNRASYGNHCVPGRNGRYYASFGLFPSIVAVPAIIGARLVSSILHLSPLPLMRVSVSLLTVFISPLVCVVLAMWIVKLGYSRLTAVFGACILAFASPFWLYAVKGFYSEPYFTLGILLAAYLLSCPEFRFASAFSGLAFGAACGSRINGVILLPVFLVMMALHNQANRESRARLMRDAACFLATFSVCAGLIGWANYARFGSPLKTGYHLVYPTASLMFSNPLFKGIGELLFNREIGLLIFAPWALIAIVCFPSFFRAHRAEAICCGAMFLFNLLFFAKYDQWHGGWVAGPRFLVPTLPFLLMPLAHFLNDFRSRDASRPRPLAVLRPLTIALVITAFSIQIVGVLYPMERYYVLWEFYQQKQEKPWWMGSMPLAYVDFLSHMTTEKAPQGGSARLMMTDDVSTSQEERRDFAYATASRATSEENFLRSFPNSQNFRLPNLLLAQMRWFGFPVVVRCAYAIFALILGFVGLIGIRKYAVSNCS
jgi:hypothetical protein